ncbi:isoprenylcysteine carboxyl methyltransferase family protein [Prevotella sp. HUN102]|uniref:isoprenylcysteine carboxyl methyltransferase family protein n=1 Tax=Prevotella sp. HUN102 TaxID=1392486 RepID=UPI00048E13DD|nr:isoprenylcysteine carboxyl methyltransferase family protein [Prevotella sp. HUN102]
MQYIIITFIFFFALRLVSLSYSIRNEKRLLKKGAKQYGRFNSLLLTLAHIAYYFGALYEAYDSGTDFNSVSVAGVGVMAFAYAMLFYVIYKLRDVWTVKLYILPEHRIERSFLFRTVRHPNYFLNIIPELVGVALLCNAWLTFSVGFPLYLTLLVVRINQEDKAMEDLWDAED